MSISPEVDERLEKHWRVQAAISAATTGMWSIPQHHDRKPVLFVIRGVEHLNCGEPAGTIPIPVVDYACLDPDTKEYESVRGVRLRQQFVREGVLEYAPANGGVLSAFACVQEQHPRLAHLSHDDGAKTRGYRQQARHREYLDGLLNQLLDHADLVWGGVHAAVTQAREDAAKKKQEHLDAERRAAAEKVAEERWKRLRGALYSDSDADVETLNRAAVRLREAIRIEALAKEGIDL